MSLRKLAGETAIYGVSSVLGRLLNFILIVPFVTRIMEGEEFGVVGDLFFYVAFLIALLVFRMDTVVFRFASQKEYAAGAVVKKAELVVGALTALWLVLGLGLSPEIAEWLRYPEQEVYVRLFVLIVVFDALAAVPLARLRLEQRPWFFAFVNLANVAVNIVLIYLLLYFLPRWSGAADFYEFATDDKITLYFFSILAAGAIRYLLLIADRVVNSQSVQKSKEESVLDDESDKVKEVVASAPSLSQMLSYAAPLVIVALCGIINTLVGPPMLKYFYGGTQVENFYWAGQYNAAMKLAVLLSLFTTAYNFAAEPFFFRQRSLDTGDQNFQIYANATRVFALVCALAIAGILLLLPILQLYLGKDLREGLAVLPILMAANFLLALYYNFAIAYKLTDRTYLGGLIALGGSLIVLVGNFVFIPSQGIFAPALASLACFVFMTACAYGVSRKYFPVPYDLGRIGLYALFTAGVVALGWPLESIVLRGALFTLFALAMVGWEWKWLKSAFKR